MLRRAAIVLALFGCLASLVWMFTGPSASKSAGENAQVLGSIAGVLSLALAVALLWQRTPTSKTSETGVTSEQLQHAQEYLARETLRSWQEQAKKRGITRPSPVTVKWQWASEDVAVPPKPHVALLTAGTVTKLRQQLYERLDVPARVVVLGGPGSGKTTAMLLLLIDILRHRADDSQQPVPVWLTLGGWNPETTKLREWAATVLSRDYPGLSAAKYGGSATAAELIAPGRVALFLDGLDEIPPALQGPALDRIDKEAADLRLVLTSRPEEYQDAIKDGRLYDAAVIEVLPVEPEQARDFLLDQQIGDSHRAWQQVTDRLMANRNGVLAHTFTSPLALSLARDAYRSDPMALLDRQAHPTPDALLRHLLARSLDLAYPDRAEREHALRWLSWIARRMGTSRDLRWWDIPTWIPAWQRRLAPGSSVGFVVGLMDGILLGLTFGLTFGLAAWLTVWLTVGLTAGLTAELEVLPKSLFIRRIDRTVGTRLVVGLVVGLVGGFAVGFAGALVGGFALGLTFGFAGTLRDGLVGGLVGGLTFGLAGGLTSVPIVLTATWSRPLPFARSARPAETYRADLRRTIAVGLTLGLTFGLAVGLTVGLAVGLTFGLTFGFVGGLTFGLLGLTFGLAAASGPALELAKAELVLRLRGQRVRFMPLLETALERQVLRQAGAVYQFRHAALQDLLAEASPTDSAVQAAVPRPAMPVTSESGAPPESSKSAEEASSR